MAGARPAAAALADAIHWHTDVVDLQASDFAIVANGATFNAQVPKVDVRSDPGDATYRTFEVTWSEHGVEQRLSMYFDGDDTSWWVKEIRTYNGKANGDWLFAQGPFFRTRSVCPGAAMST